MVTLRFIFDSDLSTIPAGALRSDALSCHSFTVLSPLLRSAWKAYSHLCEVRKKHDGPIAVEIFGQVHDAYFIEKGIRLGCLPDTTFKVIESKKRQSQYRPGFPIDQMVVEMAATVSTVEKNSTGTSSSLSVVIPHYHQALSLERTLQGLSKILTPRDEVIVVDDGSLDVEFHKAQNLCQKYQAIFISKKTNEGPAAARNLGAKEARNDFLLFVDSDDTVDAEGLRALRNALDRNPQLDGVYGSMRIYSPTKTYDWIALDPHLQTAFIANYSPVCILYRRKSFLGWGGFWEEMRNHLEDWEFHLRILLKGARLEMVPVISYHYQSQTQTSRNRSRRAEYATSVRHAFQHALDALTPDERLRAWPDISKLLTNLAQERHLKEEGYLPKPGFYDIVQSRFLNFFGRDLR